MTKKVFNLAGGKHSDAAYAAFENRLLGSVKASISSFLVSAGTGMQAVVSAGDGLISIGSGNARRIQSDANENVTVTAASASFNRRDTVVAYIDTAVTPSTGVVDNTNNVLKFACVAGTAAATPAAPSDATIQAAIGAGNPFLRLYEILVPQNAVNLSGATFTDVAPLPPQIGGWRTLTDAWAYSSWSSTTRIGVITVPSDATLTYTPGMRIRIRQSTGGTKYGIVVAVSSTTITVFFPSGITLNNESIFYPAVSTQKIPLGFDASPISWRLAVSATGTGAVAAFNTYYNFSALNLVVPIGAWNIGFDVASGVSQTVAGIQAMRMGISTANNSATDTELIRGYIIRTSATSLSAVQLARRKHVIFGSQTTVYFVYNIETGSGTVTWSVVSGYGDNTVFAECAYL